jgi:hypothetical protein
VAEKEIDASGSCGARLPAGTALRARRESGREVREEQGLGGALYRAKSVVVTSLSPVAGEDQRHPLDHLERTQANRTLKNTEEFQERRELLCRNNHRRFQTLLQYKDILITSKNEWHNSPRRCDSRAPPTVMPSHVLETRSPPPELIPED